MHRGLVLFGFVLAGSLAGAQDLDPPHSAACSQSLQALQHLGPAAAGLAPAGLDLEAPQ